jgi:hypothetical protein
MQSATALGARLTIESTPGRVGRQRRVERTDAALADRAERSHGVTCPNRGTFELGPL